MPTTARVPTPPSIVILGAGVEGSSAAAFLLKHGLPVTVADRAEKPLPVGATGVFGDAYLAALEGASVILRSPGVRRDLPELVAAEAQGALVTSATKLFLEGSALLGIAPAPGRTIAITGSNGKTTCTSLVHALAQTVYARLGLPGTVWLGGNIGTPVLDFHDDVRDADWVILELSSFQLEDVAVSPWLGVVLNVTPNHLDQHPTFEAYAAAKQRIIDRPGSTWAVLSANDPVSAPWAATRDAASVRTFDGAIYHDEMLRMVLTDAAGSPVQVELPANALQFRTHPETVHAAAATAALLGATSDEITTALRTFTGVEHRLQKIRVLDGVEYYDDSANTTPESAIVALRAFPPGKTVILLGGSDKGTPFDALAAEVVAQRARPVLLGQVAPRILAAIHAIDPAYEVAFQPAFQTDFQAVMDAARALAKPGDVVLLSTGCASFGMFQNYKHRAEEFARLVHAW